MSSAVSSHRILVIRRRYLGDVALLGPLLRSLRLHWPASHLACLVGTPYSPVLSMNPDVNQTIAFDNGVGAWLQALRVIRRSRFTHVLDLDNRARTALTTRLSGASTRIALHHGANVSLPRCYTAHEIIEGNFFENHHITDYYSRVLRQLDVPVSPDSPQLTPHSADLDFIRQLPELAAIPADAARVLIHPGSRSPHRIWPADRFAAIITKLFAHNITPILVAGPGEQAVVREIQSLLPTPAIEISRPLSIPQLAALFASTKVLLCHDSGPMHLAAAVGAQVVALFSSQNMTAWKPHGHGHITLQTSLPCTPCLSPAFCKPTDSYFNHCVRHLSVDQVFTAVMQQLETQHPLNTTTP